MGIDVDRRHRGNVPVAAAADVDHRPPFRKPCAALVIFLQALGELVEARCDQFARAVRQGLRPLIDLDAGDRARRFDQLDQRRVVFGILPDRLVIEDDAGDVFAHRLRGAEQHLAVVAARLFGRFDLDRVKALLDGA